MSNAADVFENFYIKKRQLYLIVAVFMHINFFIKQKPNN